MEERKTEQGRRGGQASTNVPMLRRGGAKVVRNYSSTWKPNQSPGGEEKPTSGLDASGLADSQDPLALRKAAWKYGILSVLFGVVAGVIQYKRSSRETNNHAPSTQGASRAPMSSSIEEEPVVPDELVELQLTVSFLCRYAASMVIFEVYSK